MTEDQIERRVEKMVDHLDRLYMSGQIDTKSYNSQMRDLDRWAESQYQWAEAERRARRKVGN